MLDFVKLYEAFTFLSIYGKYETTLHTHTLRGKPAMSVALYLLGGIVSVFFILVIWGGMIAYKDYSEGGYSDPFNNNKGDHSTFLA